MNKYKNKYRIPSARAPFWDYGWNAAYYVTICTQNRLCWFGDIDNRADTLAYVSLSAIGHIANSCWYEIPNHFPFVELGAHIIMPNHVHGIIIINKPDDGRDEPSERDKPKNQFGPQSNNLASIIRGFKIGVTKNARQINPDFAWQSRFHDHIIRDNQSYQKISAYIINNPAKWQDDKFFNR